MINKDCGFIIDLSKGYPALVNSGFGLSIAISSNGKTS